MGKQYKAFEDYNPPALYQGMKRMKDVYVEMRDGCKLCIDINLPDGEGPFPVLLAYGMHNKDYIDVDYNKSRPAQPSWSHFWFGCNEGGDTIYLTSRGYVHVVAQARSSGKSGDGEHSLMARWDHYDLIEWIAAQDWCDGNVGMVGLSNFGVNQLMAAASQPPHLKAIYPQDPGWCYGFFREMNLGGVMNTLFWHIDPIGVEHTVRNIPPQLEGEEQELWEAAMNNPDYQMYTNIFSLLTQKGQHDPAGMFYKLLLYPYDRPEEVEFFKQRNANIKIPVYTGSGQYAIDYHFHWQGAQDLWYELKDVPKKLLLGGPAHQERPYHEEDIHHEMLKWFDYWLKGIDTGIMEEPPVRYWVTGENKWRYAENWPIPETQWTPYYFRTWERLSTRPMDPNSYDGNLEPDAFVQMPPTLTNQISKLRYMTDPLPEDVTIAGPISATFYASIDSEDTNWFVTLKDLGPDTSDRTARKGEWEIKDLPEKYLTKGMLKASMRALDENLSTPYKPWHKLTKEAQEMVVPGEINEYNIEVLSVCHTFKAGHRICVEISAMDMPDGANGVCDVEYIPYHICRNATVLHKIYRDGCHPSRILLPIIPRNS